MKQLYTLLILLFPLSLPLFAQTAVINEFSSDPTMYDGAGGEFVELYCPLGGGACDISCWVVSDGQGLITIPDGTVIPDGGYYLIAHAPAFNCDSCDFFGIPVDLNTATCGCLNGGSYGTGIDGNPALILGRFGNSGELMLLYNNSGTLLESWSFDNAAGAYMPNGGLHSGTAVGTCAPNSINIPAPDSSIITDVGPLVLGCNTSYTRNTDGSLTWVLDDHPTPGASNVNMGNNAFEYQYRIDGGPWITLPKNGSNNIDSYSDTVCTGDSIQFRIQIENYQHAVLAIFDSSGRYGSYFQSPLLGLMPWAIVNGLGAAMGDTLILQSNPEAITVAANNLYRLQWSDFKNGQGSFFTPSRNECYERMDFSLRRNQRIDSATIVCVDSAFGLSAVTVYPTGVNGYGTDLYFVLYDDAGAQTNPIDSNQSGLFSLSTPALVNYYVVVRNQCNEVLARDLGAFCLGIAPCPQITSSSFVKNSAVCGATTSTVVVEDFESGSGGFSTSISQCTGAAGDYFTVTDGSTINGTFTGITGSFFAAQDIDGAGCPAAPGANATLTISGIDISGCTDVSLQIDAAEDDDGANQDWDAGDFVHFDVSIDGGPFVPAIWFEGLGGFNTAPFVDTDFDGTGDGAEVTSSFQPFLSAILGSGTTMTIRVTIQLDSGDEDIAFDNISIVCASLATCQACPNDTLTFSVAGTNLPMGGTIDWYYGTTAGFSPYTGAGTFIGSTPIPTPTNCSSPTVVINEVMYQPSTNNGVNPDAGEMIELLGPPGTDLSCFVLTDGDWTITFPPGSVIPADGIFTIGNDNVYGIGTFDLDAENCACFTDGGGGDGLLILTDGGEYISLFNASGTFVQGLIYGTPSAGNTPPNGSFSTGGVINTVGLPGCPTSVTIPGAGAFETAGTSGAGVSLIRDPDGSGPWATQTGGSINACNLTASLPPVPDFDYLVPLDACNETRIYKGIINPHPNTVACPNTDPSAFTDEFVVEVICPDANMQGTFTSCAANLPMSVPVGTNNILSGTDAFFVYALNGALDTINVTVVNDTFFFNPTVTGTYSGVQIIPTSGCIGPADTSVQVTIVPTPAAPTAPSAMVVCEGDTALVTASGASSFEWSLSSNFIPISGTGTDYLVPAPDSVFVRSVNQDDVATVSCPGGSIGIAINTQVCNVILLGQELLTFDATKMGEKALLDWKFQSSFNFQDFYLERSGDGMNYRSLATVPSDNAIHLNVHDYDYLDQEPLAGWNYYRLKYPSDAGYLYSAARALYFGAESTTIGVYPSPTKGKLTVDLGGVFETETIVEVYDVLGQQLRSQVIAAGAQTGSINLSDMPAAVYVISVEIGNQKQHVKVVKE